MEKIKLFDGELKLMELLWDNKGATASAAITGITLLAVGKTTCPENW